MSFTVVRCQPIKPGDTVLYLVLPVTPPASLPISGAYTTLADGLLSVVGPNALTIVTNNGDLTVHAGHGGIGGTLELSAEADFLLTAIAGGSGLIDTTQDLTLRSDFGFIQLAEPASGGASPTHAFDPRGWVAGNALGFDGSGALVPIGTFTPAGPAGGVLDGTYPNPTLAPVIAAATVGDASHVARITVNTGGQVTAASAVAISGAGIDTSAVHSGDAAGGQLAGTYPNPTVPARAGIDTTAVHSGDAAGGDLSGTYPNPTVNTSGLAVMPTGTIIASACRRPPTGYLACDAAAVSRTTFATLFAAIVTAATCTISIASPAVITENAHGHLAGDPVIFTTTGALPTGLTAGVTYFVGPVGITTNTYRVRATIGGADIVTTGTQSGVHTSTCAPYGLGDGSTTFNVPLGDGRELLGTDATHPLGSSGGALTHQHGAGTIVVAAHHHGTSVITVVSHTHDLQNHTHTPTALWADIVQAGGVIANNQIAISPNWSSNTSSPATITTPSVSRGNGTKINGTTDAPNTNSSGAAAPALTGNTDDTTPAVSGSTADATGPIDPYVAVRHYIKT